MKAFYKMSLFLFFAILLTGQAVAKPTLKWVGAEPNFVVQVNGINFKDIADFTQDDRVITNSIAKLMKDGKAQVIPSKGSFNLMIQDVDFESGSTKFAIHLKNGTSLDIQVPVLPITMKMAVDAGDVKYLDDDINSNAKGITPRTRDCGGYSDSANPYPCCSNGSAADGNCTWYVWYRAHQSSRGWNMALPIWNSPSNWINGAKKDSRFVVSSTPKRYSDINGYSIAVSASHVAWV